MKFPLLLINVTEWDVITPYGWPDFASYPIQTVMAPVIDGGIVIDNRY